MKDISTASGTPIGAATGKLGSMDSYGEGGPIVRRASESILGRGRGSVSEEVSYHRYLHVIVLFAGIHLFILGFFVCYTER